MQKCSRCGAPNANVYIYDKEEGLVEILCLNCYRMEEDAYGDGRVDKVDNE